MDQIQRATSEPERIIVETLGKELFPSLEKLKDLLIRIQNCRIPYYFFSIELNKLEKEYFNAASNFFLIDKKLKTPNLLFGLENSTMAVTDSYMIEYFKFQGAFNPTLAEGMKYIEIIDRTLDRKNQTMQNNRTFTLALTAIVVSLLTKYK